MTIVYDPLTYRTVVARPGEIPYKFWSVNKHVIDAAAAGICTLHSGDEAPGDTSRLWLDLTMPENAVGAVKAYDGASWVALTPALFYSHIAGGAGGFVTDLEMATYVSGLIGVSLQAWGENLDQWSAIDPTAKEDTGVAATLDAAHLAAGDPHPQYLTAAEGAAAYQPLDAELTSLSGASANGVSLVTAANYAAMRALLDLEAGTDFLAPAAIAAAYQPLDSDLTAIAALTTTAFGRAFLAFADEAAFKAGVNLEIGVDVQAYDADLTAWAAVNPSSYSTTAQIAAAYQPLDSDLTAIAALTTTAYGRAFLALADAAAGRTALGLGTLATQSGTFSGTSSGTNTGDQTITLTGDVTGSGTGSFAATLATVNANTGSWGLAGSVAQFVVNAKGLITSAANVAISIASTAISDATAAGRSMLTAANAAAQTALLSAFVGDSGAGGTKGLVPAPIAGDATKFLKGDGTFASIPGGGDALTANPLSQFAATTSLQLKNTISDETGSGALVFATSPTLVTPALGTPVSANLANCTGLPTTGLVDEAVTYAKMQNISATARLLGRKTAAAGDPEECTLSEVLDFVGSAARGDLLVRGATTWGRKAKGTAGQVLVMDADDPVWADQIAAIPFVIDGGGVAITTGVKGDLTIPFACTILEWTLLGDQSGSIVVDVWKDTYANFPPTIADVITASAKPTISATTNGQSSTLTGWTTTITAGDTLRYNVNSATTIQRATLSLKVRKT